jgi:hypothetical protein
MNGVNQFSQVSVVETVTVDQRFAGKQTAQCWVAGVVSNPVELQYGFTDGLVRLEIVDKSLGLVVVSENCMNIYNHHSFRKMVKYLLQ